jgi:hypothetical protein
VNKRIGPGDAQQTQTVNMIMDNRSAGSDIASTEAEARKE